MSMYVWVCWQSRLDDLSISRLDSYAHNDIWDAEWWWESRLDFSMSNLEQISMRLSRLIIKLQKSRLDFYVWIWRNFRPLGWQTAILMLRSLSTQHPQGFRLDSIQIPDRLPNDINHSFIFNKPFNNIKWGVFCIIEYIMCV